jgi:hypothetical protein
MGIMNGECSACGQDMSDEASTKGCTAIYVVFKDEPTKAYIRDRSHFDEESGRCHDCGIIHGYTHHINCDVERCPRDGNQFLTCGCGDKAFTIGSAGSRIVVNQ